MTAATGPALQQHPLSAAFPAMAPEDLEALAEDIKRNGQREPGVLYEGMVLDGWHRYQGCNIAGVTFQCAPFNGDDPVAFVLSHNLVRRHLTASQRAAAVVAVHNWRPAGVTGRAATLQGTASTSEMAREAEVGERTIVHAKRAQEIGLGPEVKDGKVSASTAAAIGKLPKGKRDRAVKAVKEGRAATLQGTKPGGAKVSAELIDLQGKYADLLEKKAELEDALAEMTHLAASAKAFEEKTEFKEMQVLRVELKSCKRRRDELMAENSELRKENKKLREKLKK